MENDMPVLLLCSPARTTLVEIKREDVSSDGCKVPSCSPARVAKHQKAAEEYESHYCEQAASMRSSCARRSSLLGKMVIPVRMTRSGSPQPDLTIPPLQYS